MRSTSSRSSTRCNSSGRRLAGKAAPARRRAPKAAGGYLAITGKLTGDSAAQIEGLRRAIVKKAVHAKLDLSTLASFDDAGARLLAAALGEARRAKLALTLDRQQKLKAALDAAVKSGREGGEGAWLLSLELLQWAHDQSTFDDRAIEYAIAFEMSPPSWEPPPLAMAPVEPSPEPSTLEGRVGDIEAVVLSGVIAGQCRPARSASCRISRTGGTSSRST